MQITFLEYKDIAKYRYLITTEGRIFNNILKTEILGSNPKFNKGYCRVRLKTENGSYKEYNRHVLVMHTFSKDIPKPEVNHIDGNKEHCNFENLEYCTRKENMEHAVKNNLIKYGEDIHRSIFTNDEVHEICKLMEAGIPLSEIIRYKNYPKSYIKPLTDILHKKSWIRISSQYNISYSNVHYKVYSYDDLVKISIEISKGVKNKQIASLFPQYNQEKLIKVIKKMKQGKLYKSITQAYF